MVAGCGSGAALRIESGGVRVTGASTGTPTPVFIHKVDTAVGGNLCAIQDYSTVIDNKIINGVPGAMLIVTPNYGPKSTGTAPAFGIPAVYYDSLNECGKGAGRWVIYNLNTHPRRTTLSSTSWRWFHEAKTYPSDRAGAAVFATLRADAVPPAGRVSRCRLPV